MKKLIIGLLVIAGIVALLLPKFIGSQGTKIHNDFFQEQAQQLLPGVIVESDKMDNGWFNSEGQHRVKLSKTFLSSVLPGVKSIELDKDVDVLVNTKFHHGPLAFSSIGSGGGSFSPVLAVAESTFKIEANGTQTDFPGTLFTQVNPTGTGGKAKYVVDAYSQKNDDAQIDFEGMVLDFDISDKGAVIDGNGKSGKLSVVGDNGEKIVINSMHFETDLEDQNGLMFGDGSFTIGDMSFDDGHGQSFALKNVDIKGANDGDGDVMKSEMQLSIGEFVVSNMKFEDFTFDYNIDNLDTQALAEIQAMSKAAQSGTGMPDQAGILEQFKKMIERSPTININELSLKTPEGKVEADLHLSLPEEVDMGFFPFSLLPQIQGDANLRIPKPVMVMLGAMKPGLAEQADMLSQMGMIELDGNDYVAVFKMRDGEMTLNGNPVPLPGMF